jgi:hypothetical protein
MCERPGFYPLAFAMSRKSFIQVEESFGLPQATLPLICRNTGMEYYKLEFGGQGRGRQSPPSICKPDLENPVKHSEANF